MDDNTRFLAAILKQDWELYDALVDEFDRQGKGTPVAVIAVAFDRLTKQVFSGSVDRAAVIRFVADARAFFPEGKDIDPRLAEALVCATVNIDEPGIIELIESVDVGPIAETEGQLLFKMVHDRQMSHDEIDAFLRDVESQLAQLQGGAS
jgi:hypothetical protein